MGPDELDDLLATIRAEAKEESSGGALALYEGTREHGHTRLRVYEYKITRE